MKPGQPVITLQEVVKRYTLSPGNIYEALHGVSLVVKTGEFVAIMGPSGSGKSTLMHIMGALDTPTTGKLIFKEQEITSYTPNQLASIRNREIGFVFQSFNLLPRTSVYANIEKPLIYGAIPPSDRNQRVSKMMHIMQISDKAKNLTNQLSGGQVQRVAIARALVMDPSVVLADEPTGNLDTKTSAEIMEVFRSLNKSGKTIIIITHDPDIARYASRHIKLVDGKIIRDETKKTYGI